MRNILHRLEKMKAQVELWQREIEWLQTRIARSSTVIGGRLDRKIAGLRSKQQHMLDRLEALPTGADPETAADLEKGLKRVWGFIREKAGQAGSEFERGYLEGLEKKP